MTVNHSEHRWSKSGRLLYIPEGGTPPTLCACAILCPDEDTAVHLLGTMNSGVPSATHIEVIVLHYTEVAITALKESMAKNVDDPDVELAALEVARTVRSAVTEQLAYDRKADIVPQAGTISAVRLCVPKVWTDEDIIRSAQRVNPWLDHICEDGDQLLGALPARLYMGDHVFVTVTGGV